MQQHDIVPTAAEERAQQVIRAAELQDIYALERSASGGEVWFYGPYILRVQAGGTLEHETRLLQYLPASIPHAPLVASGDGWLVQRRVPGDPLSAVWSSLGESRQRAAAQQLAAILINLHQVRISGAPSLSPRLVSGDPPADIIRLATNLRDRDPILFGDVIGFTRRTMATITPPLRWGFIHRDLHFEHVLWNGERITALLDFQTAILAPRELELETILRFCRYPSLYAALQPSDLAALPGWLQEDYPLLFSEAGLETRLRLYSIEHDLRLLNADNHSDPAALDRLRAAIEG